MFTVTHPVGNQNVRELLKTLEQEDHLHSFHTSISYRQKFEAFYPNLLKSQLMRRFFEGVNQERIITHPSFDICRLIAQRMGLEYLTNNEKGFLRPDNLYKYLDKKTAKYLTSIDFNDVTAIYGYDAKCLETFRAARKKGGIKLYYEAAFGYTPYVAELLQEEISLNPEWESSIPLLSGQSISRQKEEMEIADHIVVASQFAKSSFVQAGFGGDISVINYGAPASRTPIIKKHPDNKKLRVIYVGALTQQKGISYLFDAISMLPNNEIDFTLIGQDYSQGKNKLLTKLISKHTWLPSAPHNQVLEELASADVLVLPSIAEAFGLVVLEALSQGTVVIVSENCGGSDVVTDGVNGFIVPIRDSNSIAAKLELLNKNRSILENMKVEALQVAHNCTWGNYSNNLKIALGLI